MKNIKVGIICNLVVPYTIPVFNALSRQKGIDLEVIYIAKTAPNRIWDPLEFEPLMKYKHVYRAGVGVPLRIKGEVYRYVVDPLFPLFLLSRRYQVILTYGWFDFQCQIVSLLKNILKVKQLMWSDSTSFEKSGVRSVTAGFVRWIVDRADLCIASGTNSKQYFRELGISEALIKIVPNTVDTNLFSRKIQLAKKRKKSIRETLDIPLDSQVILYLGQFIRRKGVDLLLEAFAKPSMRKAILLIVGYGEELESYKEFIAQRKLKNVRIIPGVRDGKVFEVYAAADCLVLPSREETWGLVINEAIAGGLPVVVSDRVGALPDLVIEGKTGYKFSSDNPASLKLALEQCLVDIKKGKMKSSVFRSTIARFKPEIVAKTLASAIYSTVK